MTSSAQPPQGIHFLDSEWVDFIHDLLPLSRKRELYSHIDGDCSECRRSVEFWRSLKQSLNGQPDPQAPAPLILAAQQIFRSRSPWAWLRASAEWAKQLFDSMQQPALAAGVRGSLSDVRHLIYEAEPYVIDVTVKSDPAQTGLWLLGQVLNGRTSGEVSEEEIHVVLLSGEDLVAKTVATSSGEFELACEMCSDLSLFISVRGERAIGISLADSGKAAVA